MKPEETVDVVEPTAEEEDVLILPAAPPGMVAIPPPTGFRGHIFVPDPEGWLSAKAISQWMRKGVPAELENEIWIYQEAYARGHMVQFHIKDGHGRAVTINDKTLRSMAYPNVCAQIIVNHTEGLLQKARDKKK